MSKRAANGTQGPTSAALRRVLQYLPVAAGWAIVGFAASNLIGGFAVSGFDANVIWLPQHAYAWWGIRVMLGGMVFLLAWSLLRPTCGPWRLALTQAILMFFAAMAAAETVRFYRLLSGGEIVSAVPVPFVVLVIPALASQMIRIRRSGTGSEESAPPDPETSILTMTVGLACVGLIFLMGQFFLFGSITHRRKVDCIVVMGAGVMAGGRASLALYDRTRTGCALYRDAWSDRIILSGGPAIKLRVTEPEVMAGVAEELGIPSSAIIRDELGVSTFDTVLSVRQIMRDRGWHTALVVSHDYHLSRTWLAFRRAGINVWTVPAQRTRFTLNDAYTICREMAAWAYYYFRPLWQPFDMETEGVS